jgi:glycosyltransferase involved in cell wall biosynthesis
MPAENMIPNSMPHQRELNPLISVVIPCRNEKAHISDCLLSIFEQLDVPGGFEVLVADGMSDDGTREILNHFSTVDERLKVIDNPQKITSRGLNKAIRVARGQYIAIMGAHAHYAADYLRSSLEVSNATAADNVGGCMTCLGESSLQKAIAMAHHSSFSVGGARWHNTHYEGPADTVFGGFYRREVFDRIGLFDEILVRNQDDELNLRLAKLGGKIWHSPRIKSWYYPRASLRALFRQYLQYGYWKVRVVQKHRKPASLRHLVPGAFVASLIMLPLLALLHPAVFWLWFALIALYVGCNFFASLTTARGRWSYVLKLPLVFACYHFGFGIGFLCGLFDFVILRRAAPEVFTGLTRSSNSPFEGA